MWGVFFGCCVVYVQEYSDITPRSADCVFLRVLFLPLLGLPRLFLYSLVVSHSCRCWVYFFMGRNSRRLGGCCIVLILNLRSQTICFCLCYSALALGECCCNYQGKTSSCFHVNLGFPELAQFVQTNTSYSSLNPVLAIPPQNIPSSVNNT